MRPARSKNKKNAVRFVTNAKRERSLIRGGALPAFWACCLILTFGAVSDVAAESGKRVLIVHSFGSVSPPSTTRSISFETELTEHLGEKVNLDEVFLDHALYADTDMEEALVGYLQKRQARWRPDLVVPIGSPACKFVEKYRERLFPQTPVVYTGMDRRRLGADALKNAAFVGANFDSSAFIEDSLQLAPDTTNIVCIIGASPMEHYWTTALQSDFARFTNRVSFTWLNNLSFDQTLERVRKLPPHSFIFLFLLNRDATGVTHNANEALKRIREVANAPMNGVYEDQMGLGVVGGRLYRPGLEGKESARLAVRILHGEAASSFPPEIIPPTMPQYDWRELRRWNISEDRLPAGSVVKYRQPTVWERHKYLIISGLSLVLLQSILITVLVVNLNRRRKAERSLLESEERFRLMADSVPVLIWMTSIDKKCVFFNRGWLDFTGRTMAQELGSGWADGVHADDLERCLKVYYASFDARAPFEMEYRLRRHDGEYRWVLDRGVPRYAPNREFLGYVGVAIDLTDRKRAQEARQSLAHALRLAVVGEFTAMVVHELNQPLNATLLNLDAAKGMLDPRVARDGEVLEILADIRTDNLRAGDAIRHIRALVSKHEIEMQPVDVNAAVLEALRLAKGDILRRGVQLHADCHAPSSMVRGDVVHLEQVVLNLVANGMDAMKNNPASERHLFVSTAAGVDGYVEIAVKDTGHGIGAENLSQIFESFFTTKPDGMGMGLSMARSIVQLHSGRLWAENNKDGRGTTLRFILPVLVTQTAKPLAVKEGMV